LQIALVTKTHYALVVQILEQLKKNLRFDAPIFQSGVFIGFFAYFHLETKLNNSFSSVL
jgi:hypothetical protein